MANGEDQVKKLKRANDRYLGGVCGGIAEFIGVNPLIIRIFWGLISAVSLILPGLLIYIVFWIFMDPPDE